MLRTSHLQHLELHPSVPAAECGHLLFNSGVVCDPRCASTSPMLHSPALFIYFFFYCVFAALPIISTSLCLPSHMLFSLSCSPLTSSAATVEPRQELTSSQNVDWHRAVFIICEITSSLTSVGVKTPAKYFRTLAKPLERSSFRGLLLKSFGSSAVSSHLCSLSFGKGGKNTKKISFCTPSLFLLPAMPPGQSLAAPPLQ